MARFISEPYFLRKVPVKNKKETELDFDFNKTRLEQMYEEAKAKGLTLWPDDAIRELGRFWNEHYEKKASRAEDEIKAAIANPQLDLIAKARETHIYAVKLFYRTYMPKKGAPPIHNSLLEYLLKLRSEGKSYRDIALIVNPKLTQADDIEKLSEVVRKRIKGAEKAKAIKEAP